MSKFRDFRMKNKKPNTDNSVFIDIGNSELLGKKSMDLIIKQARKSGILNLANRNLTEIPDCVYNINLVQKCDDTSINFEESSDVWWDDVFLSKLILTSNLITTVAESISLLDNLTYLDLSNNKIEMLPQSTMKLSQLQYLNISKNKIQCLVVNKGDFQELQYFNCSNNNIKSIPLEMSSLINLTNLNLSHNELTEFSESIGSFLNLTNLDMSYNKISSMPYTLEKLQKLQTFDLSNNNLHTFYPKFCSPVQQLWLHVNRLTNFPLASLHENLKELSLTHNLISILTSQDLLNIPNICTLTIAYNKISELPEEISKLSSLCNLDLSNNDLKTIPLSIGNMEELKSISIDGNPFRLIKRSIINSGADSIKRFLRMRSITDEPDNSPGCGSITSNLSVISGCPAYLDEADLRATGIVKLSSKGLSEVSDDFLLHLDSVNVKAFNLNCNKFTSFPIKILQFASSLQELDISSNQISEVPSSIGCLQVLRRLDVSYNRLRVLPGALSNIKTLKYLILSYNDFGESIPDVVFGVCDLNTLIMSHCGLKILNHEKILSLKKLEVLDVSNNSICNIPPELGLSETIKSLNLEGNGFRVPRPAVIAKGTSSVLEYLRSRIVSGQ